MDSLALLHHQIMKKTIFGLLILCSSSIYAQENSIKQDPAKVICLCCGPVSSDRMPTYVINEKVVDSAYLKFIDVNQIEEVTILKQSEAGVYRERAKNGVILIRLKNNFEWVALALLLKQNKIKKRDRLLPIFFNEKQFKGTDVLIDKNKKLNILVLDSTNRKSVLASIPGKYLSIFETNN